MIRDFRKNIYSAGEVWRGLRPLHTSPVVGFVGGLDPAPNPTTGLV